MVTVVNCGELLRDVRVRSGLSVRSLARTAGVSPASVDRIEHGRVAPTATLERILHGVGYVLDLRAVPDRVVPLTREDRRSLAYHRLVAAKLLDDPAAVMAKARRNLARMRRADASGRAARYLEAWGRLLDGDECDLVATLLDPSERARDLRQASPFAGVLTPEERSRVYPTTGVSDAS
jgi:transcriptional regulator with XRE-family HTH domain